MRCKLTTSRQRTWGRRGKRFWLCVETACLAAFLIFAVLLVLRLTQQEQRSAEEHAAQTAFLQMQAEQAPMQTNLPTPSAQPQMFGKAESLLKQNPDLVGMVGFGDMTLYVCQTTDNSYYASHRFDGSEDPAGMIYMDCRCSAWPLGQNTILYGHNMRDGSRFGKLNRLTKGDYLAEHPHVRYATLYTMQDYVPIAVFYANVDPSAADYFDFAQTVFENETAFDSYIAEIKGRSILDIPATAQYGDPLLTLATCSKAGVGGRLVVVCKPIEQ